jgi:Na+/pantothenate symporter
MLGGIIAIIAIVLGDNGGFTQAIHSLARVNTGDAAAIPGVYTSFFGPDPLSLLGVVILTSVGTWGLPQMVARFYSIKSEKMINKGAIVSTIFAVIIAGGCYFIGSFGRLYADVVAVGPNGVVIFDSIMPTILSRFSDLMIGIVLLLVFAASISTLSSLVLASASTLTLDFLKGHIIKKMDDKKQLVFIRMLILVFIVVSVIIAVLQYKKGVYFIAQLMGVSWGALAGSFLAPFLYGLYWKRASKISVWCCFLFSTSLMTLNIFFRSSFPALLQSPINAGAFAMLSGLILVPVISMLSNAPEKTTVENCFSCYEEEIHVKIKNDLGG